MPISKKINLEELDQKVNELEIQGGAKKRGSKKSSKKASKKSSKKGSKKSSKKGSKMARMVNTDMMETMVGGAKKSSKKGSKKSSKKASKKASKKSSKKGSKSMKGGAKKSTKKASKKSSKKASKKGSKKGSMKRELPPALKAAQVVNEKVLKATGAERSDWFGLIKYINVLRKEAKKSVKDEKDFEAVNIKIMELFEKDLESKGKGKIASMIKAFAEEAKANRGKK